MNKEEKKYIEELQSLNLSEVEARAYYHLVLHDQTAANLTQTLNLNRSYVYELLKKLIEMGLCVEIKDAVRKYRAIEPKIVLNSIIEDYKSQITKTSELSDRLTALYKVREEQGSNEIIKVLHSKTGIQDTLHKLEEQATSEVLSLCKPPYIFENSKVLTQQEKSNLRGVKHRSIYEIDGNPTEEELQEFEAFNKLGEEIRITSYLPLKVLIYDRKIVVFNLVSKNNEKINLTFTSFDHEDVAKTFVTIFEVYWDIAIPYEKYLEQIKNKNNK